MVHCPRGTPSSACRNVYLVDLLEDRYATEDDVDQSASTYYRIIEPRRSESRRTRTANMDQPKTLLEGLLFGIKCLNPFSSRNSREPKRPKTYLTVERRRGRDRRPVPVEQIPRPPPPPPMRAPRGRSPAVVTVEPHHHEPRIPEPRSRIRRPRRSSPVVVVHNSSEEENIPSELAPSGGNRRQRARTLSPTSRYEAEKAIQREHEFRQHEIWLANARRERAARQQQDAHVRAMRAEDTERHRNEEREQERRQRRRIDQDRRRHVESAEQGRARRQQENYERQRAQERQQEEDIERIRANDRLRRLREEERARLARARRAGIPRQPRHPITIDHDPVDFEERGDQWIRDAIRTENLRQFERQAPLRNHEGGSGIRRRGTVGDGQRRGDRGERRKRQRWSD